MIISLINFFAFLLNSILIEKYLFIFQLKDYQTSRYFKFFKFKFWFVCFAILIFAIDLILKNPLPNIILSCFLILISIAFHLNLIKQKKTPINYTPRLKRLYAISVVIIFVCCLFKYGAIVSTILMILLPIISNYINIYDKILNYKFIKKAQLKLQTSPAKIIAITGSNGKTSVKNILFEMLKTKYKVLVTPKSYNTPLLISKFLIENNLYVDYIILEYGARHIHDITKLCNTFGADFGIITTVSPQHLESFKSIENIYKAKKELSDFLEHKVCVFNADNLYTLRMLESHIGTKLAVSINHSANVFASDIKIVDYKTNFNLHLKDNVYNVSTILLGEHNVLNICLASALALYLNVDENDILSTIENLTFTPHRLQLIKTHIYILDDSYNCSLSSAKEAMKVFDSLPNKKMVVTPGIIEGGKNEFQLNFRLGKMLKNCDFVVIVGEHNKDAILSGLGSEKHSAKIYIEKTLDNAKVQFKLLRKNDNLLLLNDLPDDYI